MSSLRFASLLSLLLVGACYRALPYEFLPEDGGTHDGGGTLDGGKSAPCKTLDEAGCLARSDCHPATCPTCDGKSLFSVCQDKDDTTPIPCPALSCPAPCSSYTDAASCKAAASLGCVIYDCCGFAGCYDQKDELPVCLADCVPSCDYPDEASCLAFSYCRAVYQGCGPNEICGGTPAFSKCEFGAPDCKSWQATCDSLPPTCPKDFVPSLGSGGCYEGCVRQTNCCSPACTGTDRCDLCWTDYSCIPDGAVC